MESAIEKIKKECYEAIACCKLDYEYTTVLGNGINPCGASKFAYSILHILEVPKDVIDRAVEAEIIGLEELYG